MSETANILLVDDEPGMLRYIRTLLEVDEYKVETATTGEEALERVQKGLQPDLVLLDLLMPGIDGLQTLEQLRELRPGVKVVMLSCVIIALMLALSVLRTSGKKWSGTLSTWRWYPFTSPKAD